MPVSRCHHALLILLLLLTFHYGEQQSVVNKLFSLLPSGILSQSKSGGSEPGDVLEAKNPEPVPLSSQVRPTAAEGEEEQRVFTPLIELDKLEDKTVQSFGFH